MPEQLVFNKVDAADAETLLRLRHLAPDALFVSARTGEGIDKLRARVEDLLPRPAVEVDLLVPYTRGDLVARVHDDAEVLDTEHTARRHARARAGQPRVWPRRWPRSRRPVDPSAARLELFSAGTVLFSASSRLVHALA